MSQRDGGEQDIKVKLKYKKEYVSLPSVSKLTAPLHRSGAANFPTNKNHSKNPLLQRSLLAEFAGGEPGHAFVITCEVGLAGEVVLIGEFLDAFCCRREFVF